MIIYELILFTNPVDWAEQSKEVSLGFFKTNAGAMKRLADFKNDHKDWQYDYKSDYSIRSFHVYE